MSNYPFCVIYTEKKVSELRVWGGILKSEPDSAVDCYKRYVSIIASEDREVKGGALMPPCSDEDLESGVGYALISSALKAGFDKLIAEKLQREADQKAQAEALKQPKGAIW